MDDQKQIRCCRISTAKNGGGEVIGGGCTHRGLHLIWEKIGERCERDAVFIGRRPTGQIYSAAFNDKFSDGDWILTRILWLCGCEPGKNSFGSVDTSRRYIYIHGCPDSEPMGIPLSHGFVRMHSADIVELFELIEIGMLVDIYE